MKPSTAQLLFENLANHNPDVLSDTCKFSLEPVDLTLYGKDAIAHFWSTSESINDIYPTIYTSGTTIIAETLRMVKLDAEHMHYTPSWKGLKGATVAVDMVSAVIQRDGLVKALELSSKS
jgi:hypothetical protein